MPKEPKDKTCFIIMPITTPESVIESYRDQAEHFKHVLECLFKPAVQKAGYKSIPPKAKGADLIQAEIIKNLETSDIVLCDMSCLNPNVFFEFGIRTSLNKPVCIVKDELTTKVPFDTGIINHHEYQSSLEPWLLESEIKKLSDHIITSDERSQDQNTLWKYFGFKSEAVPFKGEEGVDAKLDYLTMQFDSLRSRLDSATQSPKMVKGNFPIKESDTGLAKILSNNCSKEVVIVDCKWDDRYEDFCITFSGLLSEEDRKKLCSIVRMRYKVRDVYFEPV